MLLYNGGNINIQFESELYVDWIEGENFVLGWMRRLDRLLLGSFFFHFLVVVLSQGF